MPPVGDSPLVGWLEALRTGAWHPWRESLAAGVPTTTSTTLGALAPPTTTTLGTLQATLEAMAADAEAQAAAAAAAQEDEWRAALGAPPDAPFRSFAESTDRYRRWYLERVGLARQPAGSARADRLAALLDRLRAEGKLLVDEQAQGRWSPDYFPERGEARAVGTAFLHDMLGWGADESEWPPDPYRAGWQYDTGWYPPGPGDEGTGFRPEPRGTPP